MRDKRPVDELSIEELERILAIKRREERQKQVERMRRSGRVVEPTLEVVERATFDTASQEATTIPVLSAAPEPHDPVAAALAAMTRVDEPVPIPATPVGTPYMASVESSTNLRTAFEGETIPRFDETSEEANRRANPRARRKLMDRLLLVVEVAAVLMIVFVGFNLVQAITTLERETASAQEAAEAQRRAVIPTLAPTPTLRLEQVVLPGGHIYQAGSEPVFNFNEVPAHLHARVQAEWIQPVISRPVQTSETALSLIIPKLGLDGTIVQGIDVEALKQGVGQMVNGVNPGDDFGNVVLAAHNDVYGQLFRYLDILEPGDTFQIRTQTEVWTYRITEWITVAPNDVYVLQNRQGATATLISCYPYQVNTQRIVVFADRIT